MFNLRELYTLLLIIIVKIDMFYLNVFDFSYFTMFKQGNFYKLYSL
jgi:hypothetical protein